MAELIDPELAALLAPAALPAAPRADLAVQRTGPLGSGKEFILADKASAYCYVASAHGVFPMTHEQRSFYGWCVLTRDAQKAAAYAGVEWAKAKAWLTDPRGVSYIMGQVKDKADAEELTADHLDALLVQGLRSKTRFNKNQVKLIELAQKRLGLLVERRMLGLEEGTEIAFMARKAPAQPQPGASA